MLAASCARTRLRSLRRGWLLGRHDLRRVTVCMGYASAYVAQQSLSLHVPCPPVVPPSIRTDGGGAIPSLECINIMLAHLLFRGQTLAELVEYEIGVHRRHATYKNYQHPFHCFKPTLWPPTGNGQRLIRFRWQMLKLEGGVVITVRQLSRIDIGRAKAPQWLQVGRSGPDALPVHGLPHRSRTFLDGSVLPPLSSKANISSVGSYFFKPRGSSLTQLLLIEEH